MGTLNYRKAEATGAVAIRDLSLSLARLGGEKILGLHTSTIMPDARHLYERLGFVPVRELEPLLGQQYWLYQLDLWP